MMKHMKRVHHGLSAATSDASKKETPTPSTSHQHQSDSESSSGWDVDPEVDVGEIPDCTVRKPTKPTLTAPKKWKIEEVTGELSIQFCVDYKSGKASRKLLVNQEGECTMETSGQGKGRVHVDLSEFIEIGAIKKVELNVEGTELKVGMEYRKE